MSLCLLTTKLLEQKVHTLVAREIRKMENASRAHLLLSLSSKLFSVYVNKMLHFAAKNWFKNVTRVSLWEAFLSPATDDVTRNSTLSFFEVRNKLAIYMQIDEKKEKILGFRARQICGKLLLPSVIANYCRSDLPFINCSETIRYCKWFIADDAGKQSFLV